ncbi:hypothetical protein FQA39_LY02525 [Lamprigera yunnana]|nr:hypothetical protein FQA39_LY02525 [Lamprigera yunnana]
MTMEKRASVLRKMKICRFCLEEEGPFTNIYDRDSKQSVPLPLQIMACIAIEVFANDGMPQLICSSCRTLTQQAYNFKTTCKQSDDALKLFVATGNLVKPTNNKRILSNSVIPEQSIKKKKKVEEYVASNAQEVNPEVVTLNYNSSLDLNNDITIVSLESPDKTSDNNKSMETTSTNVEHFEEDENDSKGNTIHYTLTNSVDDEDDTINPVLKVPQVETDVFPCIHCERSFPLKQLLEIHMQIHQRERSFTCEECNRKFFTKYDLSKHILTHSGLKPFSCVVCNKTFSRESLLHRHEKIHIEVPKYMCTICERTFLTKEDLDVHSEKHKKKRPFACRLCTKRFVFKQGLERHELTHADQKPHKCNYCEASFTSPIKLTRHITSHAGLRPYPCKLCGRTFLLSHHLTRHMRSHYSAKSSNAPPVCEHKCDVCSMSFRRKDSLINHSAIHSMVNLKCVICNTSFDNAKMVKEHITTHLSGLPYPCDRCDYSFDTQDQLEEHELKHAEMEYEEQIEKEVSLEQARDENAEEYNSDDEDEDEEDEDDEGVAEFTITNSENPEVVRRSKRATKIKNYAEFLKDELGSEFDEELNEESVEVEDGETIKPVVRTEGTKVYTRKNLATRPKEIPLIQPSEINMAPLDQITQPQFTTLENLGLTKQAVNALPNKKYVDMKIGDKTLRVQKLMMTKAEIEAMAREGKIEVKGNTILLKSNRSILNTSNFKKPTEKDNNVLPKSLILPNSEENDKTSQSKLMGSKTYSRKTVPIEENIIESQSTEVVKNVIVKMETE